MTTTVRESLSLAAVEVISKPYDWVEEGEGEGWNTVPVPGVKCSNCRAIFSDREVDDVCTFCREEDGYLEERVSQPAMNYVWPLPVFSSDAVEAQGILTAAQINICLVQVTDIGPGCDDEYGLALTGGGMNLAWDIARAYVLLGYVPPATLYDNLPCFAGQDNRQEPFASVLKACHQGIESARKRLIWAERKLCDSQSWTGENNG